MTHLAFAILLLLGGYIAPAHAQLPTPGTWSAVSTNTLADVLWRDAAGKTVGQLKGAGSIEGHFAWSGGAMDTDRCVLIMDADGGHGDGADNGAYQFDLAAGRFSMLRAPTVDLIPTLQQPTQAWYTDAAGALHKASRHNYAAQVYMPPVKRVWQGSGYVWWSGGGAGYQSWETDVLTGASAPTDNFGIGAGFDGWNSHPELQSVWAGTRVLYVDYGRLRAYDPLRPAGSRVSSADADEGNQVSDGRHREQSPLYDPRRDRVVLIGSHELANVYVWEPVGGEKYRRRAQALAAPYSSRYAFGVAPLAVYDPVGDRYLVFPGGRLVYAIHPETWAVTDLTPTSGATPDAASSTGTYNRGGYCPAQDVVVVVHKVAGSAWAWKPVRDGSSPPVVTPPPVVEPPIVLPPPTGGLPDLPTRVLVALEGPAKGKGIWLANGMKHVTGALHPPSGRLYFIGGDYTSLGDPASQSYVQEGWSLDLRERAASSDPAAGWRLAWPYCSAAGAVTPKHPDYVGWAWDPKRSVFWMVPGTMIRRGSEVCAGETMNGPDAAYPFNRLMTFTPATGQWADAGGNIGPDAEDSWMATLDPTRDRLVRFGWNGAHGGTYSVLDLATMRWGYGSLGVNALGKDIRVFKDYHAPDIEGRRIYAMDGVSGRLHAFHLDTLMMADLGPIPGGPVMAPDDGGTLAPTSNQTYPVWDSTAKRLIWLRDATVHVYDPAARTWEAIPAVTSPPGLPVGYRTAVYDSSNNVTVFMGGNEVPNPNLLLFRYAAGGGTPPVTPPPVVTPPIVIPPPVVTPPAKPRVTVTCPAPVECVVVVP